MVGLLHRAPQRSWPHVVESHAEVRGQRRGQVVHAADREDDDVGSGKEHGVDVRVSRERPPRVSCRPAQASHAVDVLAEQRAEDVGEQPRLGEQLRLRRAVERERVADDEDVAHDADSTYLLVAGPAAPTVLRMMWTSRFDSAYASVGSIMSARRFTRSTRALISSISRFTARAISAQSRPVSSPPNSANRASR